MMRSRQALIVVVKVIRYSLKMDSKVVAAASCKNLERLELTNGQLARLKLLFL